jgi:prepilin signal peptidase PulO-like enzyme (type II secretory pathway)
MIVVLIFLLGLALGSFVNALVWRLKKKRNFVSERSECTHCHHILAWYDLIPVISWVTLHGRCRYCKKKIEDSPLTELGVAVVFVVSYLCWPLGFAGLGAVMFGLWLISLVLLAALFLYDFRWMLLPDKLTIPLMGIGVIWVVLLAAYSALSITETVQYAVYGLASVAGLYGLLYVISKGAWVGFGDVKLGVFMGLVLGWQQGLLAVMLANIIAFLVILPGMLSGKVKRTSKIPFGPFLIIATVISMLLGRQILSWYLGA